MPYYSTASAPSPVNSLQAQSRPFPTPVGSRAARRRAERPERRAARRAERRAACPALVLPVRGDLIPCPIGATLHAPPAFEFVKALAFQPAMEGVDLAPACRRISKLQGKPRLARDLIREAEAAQARRAAMPPEEYERRKSARQAGKGANSGRARRAKSAPRDAAIRAEYARAKAAGEKAPAKAAQAVGAEFDDGKPLSLVSIYAIIARPAAVHEADVARCERRRAPREVVVTRRPSNAQQLRMRELECKGRYKFTPAPLPSQDPLKRARRRRLEALEAERRRNDPAEREAAARRAAFDKRQADLLAESAARERERKESAAMESAIAAAARAEALRKHCVALIRQADGSAPIPCEAPRADGLPVCEVHAATYRRGVALARAAPPAPESARDESAPVEGAAPWPDFRAGRAEPAPLDAPESAASNDAQAPESA